RNVTGVQTCALPISDDDRYDAMKAAVDGGASIVVCAGFMQEAALVRAASEFADTKFVFVDGYPLADANGNNLTNVAPISFKEERSEERRVGTESSCQ